jgi:hypothetical protein
MQRITKATKLRKASGGFNVYLLDLSCGHQQRRTVRTKPRKNTQAKCFKCAAQSATTLSDVRDLLSTTIDEANTGENLDDFDSLMEAHSMMVDEEMPDGELYDLVVRYVPCIADIKG